MDWAVAFFRGQALCTTAAVLGGKSLASQISEKIVHTNSSLLICNEFSCTYIVFLIKMFITLFTGSGCSLRWNSLYHFRHSVLPLVSRVIGCIVLHAVSIYLIYLNTDETMRIREHYWKFNHHNHMNSPIESSWLVSMFRVFKIFSHCWVSTLIRLLFSVVGIFLQFVKIQKFSHISILYLKNINLVLLEFVKS